MLRLIIKLKNDPIFIFNQRLVYIDLSGSLIILLIIKKLKVFAENKYLRICSHYKYLNSFQYYPNPPSPKKNMIMMHYQISSHLFPKPRILPLLFIYLLLSTPYKNNISNKKKPSKIVSISSSNASHSFKKNALIKIHQKKSLQKIK